MTGKDGSEGGLPSIEAVATAIRPFIVRTPVLPWKDDPIREGAGPVLLKLESLQITGSFKVRGAASRILHLPEGRGTTGVVACSSGNHGRAVAFVAGRRGISASVFVPRWVDRVKLEAIRTAGAEAILAGDSYDQAEEEALAFARETGRVFVHPFDDPWVVAGQATLGLEILEQAPGVEQVVVPLSGGGLVAGVASALKLRRSGVRVVAVSAQRARVMVESIRAGSPVSLPEEPTLASALAGGIGLGNRHTFRLVRELVDEHVLVSEEEIADAMVHSARDLGLVVEGGGAVGLAALRAGRVDRSLTTVVVISGGNVSMDRLAAL